MKKQYVITHSWPDEPEATIMPVVFEDFDAAEEARASYARNSPDQTYLVSYVPTDALRVERIR